MWLLYRHTNQRSVVQHLSGIHDKFQAILHLLCVFIKKRTLGSIWRPHPVWDVTMIKDLGKKNQLWRDILRVGDLFRRYYRELRQKWCSLETVS